MQFLTTFILILAGSAIMINGTLMDSNSVLEYAESTVNKSNIHQLVTVLEVYYADNDEYPDVTGGLALINHLEDNDYIRNRPLDPTVFEYHIVDNGKDFKLALH